MRDFDHNAVFVRQGQHAELECEACHAERQFTEMTHACADCHAEPELHAGHFGEDCARCHVADGWRPAQLTQHTFELDHEEAGTLLGCERCHEENYVTYSCESCHAEAAMQVAHSEQAVLAESGTPLEQCSHCHPTGQAAPAPPLPRPPAAPAPREVRGQHP